MRQQFVALFCLSMGTSAVANATNQGAAGFIEQGKLDLLARNFYMNSDNRSGGQNRVEWGQAFLLNYASGYTPGLVGFGVDAHGYALIKLDSGRGRAGSRLLVPDGDGGSRDESTVAGAAVKARVSNTELKYGSLQPANPVMNMTDNRLQPATAQGFMLKSQELENLLLEAGHFTSGKGVDRTSSGSGFYGVYSRIEGGDIDYMGGTYKAGKSTQLSLYTSRYEDLWRQYYAGASHTWTVRDNDTFNLNFNLYRSIDEGRSLAGDIDVTAWSAAAAYATKGHRFTLAHQRVQGDEPFDYLGLEGNAPQASIWLSNAVQYADFNGPNERSWQLRYDYDFAALGVPGLSFMARYIRGSDIDGSHTSAGSAYASKYGDDEKHWERDVEMRYVVQSGFAKDLSFRIRQATHRISGQSDVDVDQVRIITEMPLNIF